MSGVFDEHGIRFMFPENWTIINDAHGDAIADVMIQSPSGAFWTLQAFDDQLAASELLETTLESLGQEYEDLETRDSELEIGGVSGTGKELSFFCLDFLVAGRVFVFSRGGCRLLVMYQAEQREFDEVEPVFRAITTSLLTSESESAPLT